MCRVWHVRFIFSLSFLLAVLAGYSSYAQCVGLPTVTALGSNKFPAGLCAPVDANVTYTIAFAGPVSSGNLEVIYDWGDGSPLEVIPLVTGSKSYNVAQTHRYPAESDCEYSVSVVVRYKGKLCTNTMQLQKISSWRTDAFNGGNVNLISPATKSNVHLVCEGEDISVTFNDNTNWNCNTQSLLSGIEPIESPNTEYRWQQIVYNSPVTGNKIPNIAVDGVSVTGSGGVDIKPDYQDPRGIYFMSAPVLVNDSRRRPSLKITAPGGFGAGFPKSGDVFAVTIRYWNFCNPYDDPEIPGPPVDPINGDYAPVEKTALIKVLAPPPALQSVSETSCFGSTPSDFSVTGLNPTNLVNWYAYDSGSDKPGALIASTTSPSLPLSSHSDWKNNKTPGLLHVWATQRTNTSGATNCESVPVLVTRIIREDLIIPAAVTPVPIDICNGQSFTITMPQPATEVAGGSTQYTWTQSNGFKLTSTTNSSATFLASVTDFGSNLFVDHIITVSREYTSAPGCSRTRTYTLRVYRTPIGGTLSSAAQVCEMDSIGDITLAGHVGQIKRWEVKKANENFTPYIGQTSGNSISPGKLPAGRYTFRAVVTNGPCNEVYSNEQNVEVSANPGSAYAGDDQFICSALQSAALNASFPESGKGLWTYISSVPSGLPSPSFTAGDPNTTVRIDSENAGAYTLRWTITNGACTSADDVIIDFGTDPTDANAGNDKSVCGSATAFEANVPEKGQASWIIVSGPNGCIGDDCGVSIQSPSSPASTVELSGGEPVYGAYTFRWSISSGGNNCFLKTDDVTLTFQPSVSVSVSDVNQICLDKNNPEPVDLIGYVSGPVSSVEWVNVSGEGTVSVSELTTDKGSLSVEATYWPTLADYNNGLPVRVMLKTISASGSCMPIEEVITLDLQPKPVANAGNDVQNICDSYVQLNATAPESGAGIWTTAQPGVIFDDPTNAGTVVRNLPVGITSVSWTVTSANGTCVSSPTTINLTRVAPPHARDLDITECEVTASTASVILTNYESQITSLDAAVRDITWYKNEPPPTGLLIVDPSVAQVGVVNEQDFVARIRDRRTGCSSDARLTVHVRALPKAMNAVISKCEDVEGSHTISNIDLYNASFVNAIKPDENTSVVWYNTEANAMEDRFPISEPVMVNRQKEFFAKVIYNDEPGCHAIATLNVIVSSQPAIGNIIGREEVCQGTSTGFGSDLPMHVYQVTPIPGAKYRWQIPNDPDTQFKVFGGGGERDFYVLLQFPNIYSGKIQVTAELNGCVGPVVEKEITVSASPNKPIIEGPSIVCEGDANISFSASPDNFPSSAYNWEIRKISDNSVGDATVTEGQLTSDVLVNFGKEDVIISVRENNSQCVSPIATKVITVTDRPKAQLVIEDDISCYMAADGVIKTEVSGGSAPYTSFEILQTGQRDPDDDGKFEQLPQGSYSVRLKDSNGCIATTEVQRLEQPDAVPTPNFNILKPDNSCDGGAYTFIWDAASGVDYRWEWPDGALTELSSDSIREGENQITHYFHNTSTSKPTEYPVRLFAAYKGCDETAVTASVVMAPKIAMHITPSDTLLCSGEAITFYNNSRGVDNGTWHYRMRGDDEQKLMPMKFSDTAAQFLFQNTSSINPVVYEVVYEAENTSGCTALYRQNVYVFRSNTSSFEMGTVPPFEGESVKVNIHNTSEVLDEHQFTYFWTYGEHGVVSTPSQAGSFDITYYSPGTKDISLSIVNVAAQKAGKTCESRITKQIIIPVNQLRASFTATPSAACLPTNVRVNNETTGADVFLWRVYESGALVTTSNLRYPEFLITEAGTYDIYLLASNSSTHEQVEHKLTGIQILDVPHAAFDIRSNLIYVPDTDMQILNFSTGANQYAWHFGDGMTSEGFEPAHAYQKEGRYTVVLRAGYDHGMFDTNGDAIADEHIVCYDSAHREVVALNGGELEIPNAFTPNTNGPYAGRMSGDGFNDIFLPMGKGVTDFRMEIYDRWGTLVFESNDKDTGWDGYDRNGRLMPAGVYVYKVIVRTSKGENVTRAGDVTLIR